MTEEIERRATEQAHRGDEVQRLLDTEKGLLQAQRNQNDAEHHEEVDVAVHVSGHRVARGPGQPTQRQLGRTRDHVEVDPPQAGNERESHQTRGDGGERLLLLGRRKAQRDE